MKPWNHCSASQFKTFSLCERKWWFEKRSGLPQPSPSNAMLLGTEVHSLLETYLLTGDEPTAMDRASKIVRGGIESGLVPTPQGVTVELRIQLDDCDPPLVGFIDALDITGGSPEVIDHKTVGAWRWAKTEESLKADPQMIPYAVHALRATGASVVWVTHIQYLTKHPYDCREVSVKLAADEVFSEWEKLKALAAVMKPVAAVDDPNDVTPNFDACGAFGGCPYFGECNRLQDSARFSGIENVSPTKMKKEATMSDNDSILERLRARRETHRENPPEEKSMEETVTQAIQEAQGVVPPDAPAPTPPETAAPKEKEEKPGTDYSKAGEHLIEACKAAPGNTLSAKEARQVVGDVLDLKRVHWKHVQAAVAGRNSVLESDGESVGLRVKPDTTNGIHVEPEEDWLLLYIDCLPVVGGEEAEDISTLEDYLAPVLERVCEANGVADPLLMQFGEGKGAVSALVKSSPPRGALIVSSQNIYWPVLSSFLMAEAATVIRGLR